MQPVWRPVFRPGMLFAGLILGLGVMMILQQEGVAVMSTAWFFGSMAFGIVFGLLVSWLVHAVAVKRAAGGRA